METIQGAMKTFNREKPTRVTSPGGTRRMVEGSEATVSSLSEVEASGGGFKWGPLGKRMSQWGVSQQGEESMR